ncbi:hydroxyethylthiazole kinase [Intestinimonas massiliensis (ex Afouda et al. 2020)]|uniref:hydroxyethylthiazole kinase n=1 Tax=Intestinimonas massiliensis (ex Afouda et al. 2020) TaxID=1673721 RepID=UPI001030E7BC|nr:hydroxyethylthiazole kinase [Intestinimonas massiliensis (ex Afouda et al. 2020)]
MSNRFDPMLRALRREAPLIHAITNPISITQCANAVLALGARPIMAEHPREVAEITATAAALLLNLGNITDVRMEAMLRAAGTAREKGVPVVLDAVGVACSRMRRDYVRRLLEQYPPAVLKGNYAEINALVRPEYTASGVDGDRSLTPAAAAKAAGALARRYGCVVLASGETDLVTDGSRTRAVRNGTPQLGSVTGTGCMLGALCACFLTAAEPMAAAEAACVTLGTAGEKAATPKGSGTFLVNLMDRLSTLDGDTIQTCERTEEFYHEEA